jgi:hypothetical protein
MEKEEINNHPIFSEFTNVEPSEEKKGNVIETIEERFAIERKQWNARISELAKKIKDINSIASLQVDVYSTRQELVEYYHYLISLISRKNIGIRERKRGRYEFYTNGYDYKLSPSQKEMYIKVDLVELFKVRDELENHSKYIEKTMSTVDNIIFGIKHRISLEEYRRRL